MANPKMTPEEKARADGYAAGVLAERDHTSRALAERDEARRERDTWHTRSTAHQSAAEVAERGARTAEAERDELRVAQADCPVSCEKRMLAQARAAALRDAAEALDQNTRQTARAWLRARADVEAGRG